MKVNLLGVRIDNLSEAQVIEWVKQRLAKKQKFWIATPNPEMVVEAQNDSSFKEILNSADLAIPDGQGLLWAARLKEGERLREKVTGTDLMFRLCELSVCNHWRVFFLGGHQGVALKALENLKKRFAGLRGQAIDGSQELGIRNQELVIGDPEKDKGAKEKINQFVPDLLFVGFGMGKQERWITLNLPSLKIGGALVVGGAFDFYAGRVRRAPEWLRKGGFEWLWRIILEPWRWRRQLNLLRFVWLIIRSRR